MTDRACQPDIEVQHIDGIRTVHVSHDNCCPRLRAIKDGAA